MSELEEFARRELELKKTMTFGEWLRHIKVSHEKLCQMVCVNPKIDKPIQVEVLDRSGGEGLVISTYELPSDCYRILIDMQKIQGTVWGFHQIGNPARIDNVEGRVISERTDALIG